MNLTHCRNNDHDNIGVSHSLSHLVTDVLDDAVALNFTFHFDPSARLDIPNSLFAATVDGHRITRDGGS
jgi:hypothetical protein